MVGSTRGSVVQCRLSSFSQSQQVDKPARLTIVPDCHYCQIRDKKQTNIDTVTLSANRLCGAPWSKPTRAKRWLRNCSSRQDCWRERCETRTISVARKPGVRIRRKAQLQVRRNAHWEKVCLYFLIDECPKRWVLTAAHCVTGLPRSMKVGGIRLGEHCICICILPIFISSTIYLNTNIKVNIN